MSPEGGPTQRLFVGVPLPEDVTRYATEAQRSLPDLPVIRPLRVDQMHVTLAFIGEVDEARAAEAVRVVGTLEGDLGGEASVTGFLMLPSERRTRVVALAVDDADRVFGRLYDTVMTGLEGGGVMSREKRPFRPHITIARLKVPGQVRPRSDCGRVGFCVESVCLYRSELKREGASYTVVRQATLEDVMRAKA